MNRFEVKNIHTNMYAIWDNKLGMWVENFVGEIICSPSEEFMTKGYLNNILAKEVENAE